VEARWFFVEQNLTGFPPYLNPLPRGSPGEYGKHEEALKLKLGEPVVLVLPILPSYARNRMVQMGIPFIVPGSQTFIPNSLIDLRERFPQPNSKRRETLSPAAQCTVLYHLLRGPLAGISLKDIAQKVHYSPMMMTKVKDELEAGEYAKLSRAAARWFWISRPPAALCGSRLNLN
jgi:hypothetical protein